MGLPDPLIGNIQLLQTLCDRPETRFIDDLTTENTDERYQLAEEKHEM